MFATAGAGRVVARHPVDARDHARGGAGAAAVEHAHGDEAHALGDAVGRAADRAGDVGAVAVAVVGAAAVDGVEARHRAPAELRVREPDPGVDDVGGDVRRGRVVAVGRAQREVALVDAVQAPGGVVLRGVERDHAVGLDVGDRRVVADLRERRLGRAWPRSPSGRSSTHAGPFRRGCGPGAWSSAVATPDDWSLSTTMYWPGISCALAPAGVAAATNVPATSASVRRDTCTSYSLSEVPPAGWFPPRGAPKVPMSERRFRPGKR